MRGIASGLGVSCDHCHAPFADTTVTRLDYASDAKATKRVAREMMRMVSDINRKVDRALPDSARRTVAVQCITCHRAATRPQMLEDTLMHVVSTNGVAAALGEYRALREKFYGRFVYDFGQRSLNVLAARLQEQDRAGDALEVLVLNGELFPKAWDIPYERARILEQQGDTARAVALYRQVLELRPTHTGARAQLDALAPK
jgi:tetratricopeptide (TPR) repeat protein